MIYEEVARKFEQKLIAFMEDYLKQYPTYDKLRERQEQGEYICIDYSTLEIAVRQEKDLKPSKRNDFHFNRFQGCYCMDILICTQDAIGGGRYVDRRDTEGITNICLSHHIQYEQMADEEATEM